MAVATWSSAPTQTTDAEFRAWGSAISTALAACGLVQTGDTGQIDWGTVLKPAAGNAAQGYEIWRFADALQATAPVFIKIEYGSAAAATSPSLWVTLGSATNGAGTLTGITSARKQLTTSGSSVTAYASRASGAANRILLTVFYGGPSTSYVLMFGIERTHDGAGTDTAEGLLFWSWAAAAITSRYFSFSGGEAYIENNFNALVPQGGTGSMGSAVSVYPVFMTKGVLCNPCRDFLIAFNGNVTPGVQVAFTHYGAQRVYLPFPAILVPSTGRVTNGTVFLMRDE